MWVGGWVYVCVCAYYNTYYYRRALYLGGGVGDLKLLVYGGLQLLAYEALSY
jgi:hypothetical protein